MLLLLLLFSRMRLIEQWSVATTSVFLSALVPFLSRLIPLSTIINTRLRLIFLLLIASITTAAVSFFAMFLLLMLLFLRRLLLLLLSILLRWINIALLDHRNIIIPIFIVFIPPQSCSTTASATSLHLWLIITILLLRLILLWLLIILISTTKVVLPLIPLIVAPISEASSSASVIVTAAVTTIIIIPPIATTPTAVSTISTIATIVPVVRPTIIEVSTIVPPLLLLLLSVISFALIVVVEATGERIDIQQRHDVHGLHVIAVWTTTIKSTSIVKPSTTLESATLLEVTATAKIVSSAIVEVITIVHVVTATPEVPAATKRRPIVAVSTTLTKVRSGQLAQPLGQRPIITATFTATSSTVSKVVPIIASPTARTFVPFAVIIPEVPPATSVPIITATTIIPSSTVPIPSTSSAIEIATVSAVLVLWAPLTSVVVRLVAIERHRIRWHQRWRGLIEEGRRTVRWHSGGWMSVAVVGAFVFHFDVHFVPASRQVCSCYLGWRRWRKYTETGGHRERRWVAQSTGQHEVRRRNVDTQTGHNWESHYGQAWNSANSAHRERWHARHSGHHGSGRWRLARIDGIQRIYQTRRITVLLLGSICNLILHPLRHRLIIQHASLLQAFQVGIVIQLAPRNVAAT